MRNEQIKWITLAIRPWLIVGLFFLFSSAGAASEDDSKTIIFNSYVQSCQGKAGKDARCRKLWKKAVVILKNDLLTLGSSADETYLPVLTDVLQKSDEPELRAAAADAIGMIRHTEKEMHILIKAFNDPVPIVRTSVWAALDASFDPAAKLLIRRAQQYRTGKTSEPDTAPDAKILGAPIYPDATFLYFASSVPSGNVAFATNDSMDTVLKFYRSKAKSPAMTAEEFTKTYYTDYQVAMKKKSEEMKAQSKAKQPEIEKKAARMKKLADEGKLEELMKLSQEIAAAQSDILKDYSGMVDVRITGSEELIRSYTDREVYGSPMFLSLEEQSMENVKTPVRFVVVFEDKALKQTGFVIHVPATISKEMFQKPAKEKKKKR